MTRRKLLEQLKRLSEVGRSQWRTALSVLMLEISLLLHGKLKEDESGKKVLVGGYTQYGAHSEYTLGGEALYHYQGMVVEKLYDGSCEWKPENSLEEQLKEMAGPVIDAAVKAYRHRQKEDERLGISSTPVAIDADWLSEDERLAESSSDSRHMKWETICEAADGDRELEAFVQATGESKSLKEVNERLKLKDGDRDRLMKRLKRKVKKKSYPKGKGRGRKKSSENSVGFGVNSGQYVCEC